MSLLVSTGIIPTRAARLNPVAKLAAIFILAVPLVLSVDAVTSGTLLAAELVALPLLGLGPRILVRYAWPVAVALGGIWLANLLASGGAIGSLPVISVRLVALALPGLMFVLSTEPVELADALVQLWHAPARFAYGALAAFRLIPLFAQEWQALRRARRARGLDAGHNPVRAGRLLAGLIFGLLVIAIRRGIRLAAAMDARGFGAASRRTFARRSVLRRSDWLFLGCVIVVTIAAVAASVASGRWHLLFS
jgi:energy-coupling factor transport system permease protein